MSRHHSHLNTAVSILLDYDGQIPFAHVIKKFFSGQRKYGSKDRRQIQDLCYMYFRAARLMTSQLEVRDKVLLASLLCTNEASQLLTSLKPEWESWLSKTIDEKMAHFDLNVEQLFPACEEIESSIDKMAFCYSHLIQPDLFVRIRPGRRELVISKLRSENIAFDIVGEAGIALPNRTKVEDILQINKDVVIQDYSSQRVGELLDLLTLDKSRRLKVWDCCAASGGKSILAVDKLGDIDLTVSDVRASILDNLKMRFKEAGILQFESEVLDLAKPGGGCDMGSFDLIIADVPCTGSGTWGRTPERLTSFAVTEIEHYTALQAKICSNVLNNLKLNGYFLYITCSVFQRENSMMVDRLATDFGLTIVASEMYHGYLHKSDSMYAALMRKG